MKVAHYSDIEAKAVEQGASGVKIRWLITPEDGAENFTMRHFELAPNGNTPLHSHEWEHEVFILSGEGIVKEIDKEHSIKAGNFVFIPSGEKHQLLNSGAETFSFLCLIPAKK